MVGHTGFLCTSRRLADGVEPPLRRRRPSKGMYGETVTDGGTVTFTGEASEPEPPGGPRPRIRPNLP